MTSTDPPPRPAGTPSPAGVALPTPMDRRSVLGRYGEALAVRYLREQGMEVLERNWRCEHGEVDVVARDGDCLVICEVKTRRSAGFGEPVEAVTVAKARRLRRLAAAYLASTAVSAGRGAGDGGGGSSGAGDGGGGSSGAGAAGIRHVAEVRVDVVGILCRPGLPAVLRHVVGVGS